MITVDKHSNTQEYTLNLDHTTRQPDTLWTFVLTQDELETLVTQASLSLGPKPKSVRQAFKDGYWAGVDAVNAPSTGNESEDDEEAAWLGLGLFKSTTSTDEEKP